MKGFTLFEVLITVGIFALLVAVTAPITLRFLGTQNIDEASKTVLATLRQAHTQALYQRNDASFGVRFAGNSYTSFQGSSYAARVTAQDIAITLPAGVTISGITEVVFAKRTGLPSATGTLLLQLGMQTRSITINQVGLIELL